MTDTGNSLAIAIRLTARHKPDPLVLRVPIDWLFRAARWRMNGLQRAFYRWLDVSEPALDLADASGYELQAQLEDGSSPVLAIQPERLSPIFRHSQTLQLALVLIATKLTPPSRMPSLMRELVERVERTESGDVTILKLIFARYLSYIDLPALERLYEQLSSTHFDPFQSLDDRQFAAAVCVHHRMLMTSQARTSRLHLVQHAKRIDLPSDQMQPLSINPPAIEADWTRRSNQAELHQRLEDCTRQATTYCVGETERLLRLWSELLTLPVRNRMYLRRSGTVAFSLHADHIRYERSLSDAVRSGRPFGVLNPAEQTVTLCLSEHCVLGYRQTGCEPLEQGRYPLAYLAWHSPYHAWYVRLYEGSECAGRLEPLRVQLDGRAHRAWSDRQLLSLLYHPFRQTPYPMERTGYILRLSPRTNRWARASMRSEDRMFRFKQRWPALVAYDSCLHAASAIRAACDSRYTLSGSGALTLRRVEQLLLCMLLRPFHAGLASVVGQAQRRAYLHAPDLATLLATSRLFDVLWLMLHEIRMDEPSGRRELLFDLFEQAGYSMSESAIAAAAQLYRSLTGAPPTSLNSWNEDLLQIVDSFPSLFCPE